MFDLPHSDIRGSLGENKLALTPEDFDNFLRWLSPDRDEAGRLYEELHRKLSRYFVYKNCPCSEKLADQTIDRMIRKLAAGKLERTAEPILIARGFAKNIFREWLHEQKRRKMLPIIPDVPWIPPDDLEAAFHCLDSCLEKLPEEQQSLIERYYEYPSGQKKIENRRVLAQELKVEIGALRLRAKRIREVLYQCISACLEGKQTGNVV